MSNAIPRKQCRHIRTSGQRCGSAALREQTFCFYHQRTRNRPVEADGVRPQDHTFDLQPTDDRSSIQFALFEVLRRIALNQIDCKRAGHLLYGLQIAATVLPREPRLAATAPEPAPPAIEDFITDPELGLLAPEADFIPPTSSTQTTSSLSAEMDRVLSSFAQQTRRPIPLPVPALNPNFYSDPARFGYPELIPFLNEARKQAGLPPSLPEPAKELVPDLPQEAANGLVSEIGRDFSPDINATKPTRALAPGTCPPSPPAQKPDCSTPPSAPNTPEPPTVPLPAIPPAASYNRANDSARSPLSPCRRTAAVSG